YPNAFFLMIHVSDNDFDDDEISQELENQILTIFTDRYVEEKRKILVLYKDTQKKDGNDEIGFKRLSTSKGQQQLDELKADIDNVILKVKELYLYPPLTLNISTSSHAITDVTQVVVWSGVMTHRTFELSQSIESLKSDKSDKSAIGNASPSPILFLFAEEINENDICKMHAFARDVDNFFKEHLRDLSRLDQSEEFT
ncbi:9668_t:CDS:2, partial [Ambispora gerdemannii]